MSAHIDGGPDEPAAGREAPQAGYPRRVAVASLVTLGLVAVAALLIYAVHALLIIFIGILVGVMIDGLVRLTLRVLPVRRSIALSVVLVGLMGLVVAAGVLVMPRSLSQATTISVRSLLARVAGADETQAAVAGKLGKDELPDPAAGEPDAARVTTASGHRAGSLPAGAPRQPGARTTEAAPAGEPLRRELATGADLDGSAAVPALLLTLQDGGPTWWHVALFYLALQTFQSYVIQPVSQRYMVDVPPALSLAALLLLGWLCGGLGLFAAVPLVVIGIVVVKILWLRDTLGERVDLPTS